MVLLSLTASHRELDLDALERLSSGSSSVGRKAVGACEPVRGAVVISTCNRFEVYLDVEAPMNGPVVRHATEHVAELVAAASGVSVQTATDSFTVRAGSQVPEHLFSVASGLDSMVIGEREVAGQVKRALEVAREQHTTSKTLELLFQTASRTSKRVGASTALGSTGRSIVKLALDLAEGSLPEWRAVRTVLIGTGSYAGATVAALRSHGSDDVRVYSQSGRAQVFADGHGVVALPDDEEALVEALAEADLVVSVSGAGARVQGAVRDLSGTHPEQRSGTPDAGRDPEGAPEASLSFVLSAAAVARARVRAAERAAARAGDAAPGGHGGHGAPRPLVVLDLALHRDVDPAVADVEGVLLYDLQALKAHAPVTARAVVEQARGLVAGAAREFDEHQVGREADAAVVALLDDAEQRVQAEIDAAVARLRGELAARGEVDLRGNPAEPDEDDVEQIARDVRRRVHASLHARIVAVRAAAVARARTAERAVVDGAQAAAASASTRAAAEG
ncbi:glutamyl-tRNA reductase [Xylanimonas allomyrinae]|uniref:Glutamyl-tRNA reductase n=1 Tax=Xylanimonas allomyrinae TaxID=2509459 RepID=A0A4P6F0M6_9MICO|nr:glutamyl-tRNA reductase [Xylanimonas allomyrinae]QAY63888.1 glutamyl-tRNA reductase [Xylanimonas allomyrinae]